MAYNRDKIVNNSILVLAIICVLAGLIFRPKVVITQKYPEVTCFQDTLSTTMYDSLLNFNYQLRVQHPLVVTAQAVLESGNFTSRIYIESNNLYGMKLAKSRPTLAIGVRNGYAVYRCWQDSAVDYALWQSSYARNLSEEEYYSKLKQVYAEDIGYIEKVKNILK